MARTRIQALRSTTKLVRPATGDNPKEGELYVNYPDRQLGIVMPGATTNLDLIGVRFFATTTDYGVGDYVVASGQLYRANQTVTAGAFDPVEWDAVIPGSSGGGTAVTISDTPPGSPINDSFWYESDTGAYWLRLTDAGGGAAQWVQVNSEPSPIDADVPLADGLPYARRNRSWFDLTPSFTAKADVTYVNTQLGFKANTSALSSYLPLAGGTVSGNLAVTGILSTSSTFNAVTVVTGSGGVVFPALLYTMGLSGGTNVNFSNPWQFMIAGTARWQWQDSLFRPLDNGVCVLGSSSFRWAQIYSSVGTISTSDEKLKTDIRGMTDAEKRVAVALRSLVVLYRWQQRVDTEGEAARLHAGIVAQRVEEAFVAEGLDVRRYGLFCEDDDFEYVQAVTEGEGAERKVIEEGYDKPLGTKTLSIRYEELLAFIIGGL